MSSISRSRQALEAGSGGKIVRTRRTAVARARTPYDRPTPTAAPSNPPPENPNWLSRLIYSPTRSIVSGAGKVLSAVFRSDSSSEYSSEDGSDDEEYDGDYISSQEDDGLKERNGTSETKNAIEQLIRQETFSREECDKLIKIIRSRVVGGTATEDIHTLDLSASAVSEAKKWLMEKRSASASMTHLDHGAMNSSLFPQGDDDAGGSPVDVAKSYMRVRPPWSSPSIPHGDLKSTSPLGMHLFSEGTKYPLGGSSVSASKLKRDSPATGSWNIQEEIRKVRTKATEEMLKSLPSTRIDWSALSLQNRNTSTSLADDADMGDKLKNLKKATGSTMSWSTTHGLEVSEKIHDGLHKETLPLPAVTSFEPNQVLDAAVSIGGNQDINVDDQTCSTTGKEVNGSRSAYTTNGFPSSTHSLSAQLGTDGEPNQANTRHEKIVSHEKIVTDLLVEETNELQKTTETTIDLSKDNENDAGTNEDDHMHLNQGNAEVQNANENDIGGTKYNDSLASGSQNSSSMPDELSQEPTQHSRNLRSSPAAKDISVAEKPKATRPGRGNTRRGRPRGK